jgi:hypothetical protein
MKQLESRVSIAESTSMLHSVKRVLFFFFDNSKGISAQLQLFTNPGMFSTGVAWLSC